VKDFWWWNSKIDIAEDEIESLFSAYQLEEGRVRPTFSNMNKFEAFSSWI